MEKWEPPLLEISQGGPFSVTFGGNCAERPCCNGLCMMRKGTEGLVAVSLAFRDLGKDAHGLTRRSTGAGQGEKGE